MDADLMIQWVWAIGMTVFAIFQVGKAWSAVVAYRAELREYRRVRLPR